jgi:squalene-hopene/tetraprenyl-beta-curcumene cyclase
MFSDTFQGDLLRFRETVRNRLLSERNAKGYWEGELSSSALSTATALCAIEAYLRTSFDIPIGQRETLASMVRCGRQWLIDHQNEDGGWGDTTKSFTNISTTLLGWGALNVRTKSTETGSCDAQNPNVAVATQRAEQAIERLAGGLTPEVLAPAIRARYGKDQTFSVPILMALAATGRLESEPNADPWKWVPQLPFELAAFPRSWFAALQLPVVSYALPALIAIGLVRHQKRPTKNPFTRVARNLATRRTLTVLEAIQPTSGGFLEAIPLTSFVAISLIAAGQGGHPVVQRGIQFLQDSFRSDGSWAIDTHLATWVSTLSINALSQAWDGEGTPQDSNHANTLQWLLDQQYKTVHPYTMAQPGGWSWTPLSGGVPDADDTPGAMLALHAFFNAQPQSPTPQNGQRITIDLEQLKNSASAAANWLLGLQNRDGGIPTFCKGWGTLPFDRSNPDITAHSIRAWLAWFAHCEPNLQKPLRRGIQRAMIFLANCQQSDGSWIPLWFGNQHGSEEHNYTYGTSRVALAWLTARNIDWLRTSKELALDRRISKAIVWLCEAQNTDGSWGGGIQSPGSIEETALAVEALAAATASLQITGGSFETVSVSQLEVACENAIRWLMKATSQGTWFEPSPIGFYFAKLWYYEKHYPLVYCLAALERACTLLRKNS